MTIGSTLAEAARHFRHRRRPIWGSRRCFGFLYAGIDPYIGFSLGLKGILIVVFAGLGNMYGAMIGGLIFGFVSVMSVAYITPGWGDFFAYLFVVLVLLFKPSMALGCADRAYVLETGTVKLEGDAKSLMTDQLVREAYLGVAS